MDKYLFLDCETAETGACPQLHSPQLRVQNEPNNDIIVYIVESGSELPLPTHRKESDQMRRRENSGKQRYNRIADKAKRKRAGDY